MSTRLIRTVLVVLVVTGISAAPLGPCTAAEAVALKKHPSIPDPKTSKCASCHEDVAKVKVRHAAMESGCLSCHELLKSEAGGMAVRLSEPVPALCVTCHDTLAKAAAGTLKFPHSPVSDCGSCHGAHGSGLPRLLKEAAPQLCLACHSAEDVNKVHKVPVSRARCAACHDPHGSDQKKMLSGKVQHAPFLDSSCSGCHRSGVGTRVLVKGKGASLCYACHADVEERLAKAGTIPHGAVAEGRCTGCHDPHLSNEKALLHAAGPALCFPCHEEVKAKVTSKGAHKPATASCSTCHQAHASPRRGLLQEAVPGLCLKCHPLTEKRAPRKGAPAESVATPLAKKHLGADMRKVNCLSCHDPHGSPSLHLFAAGSIHAPFEAGCDSCHKPGRGLALVETSARTLCLACHADIAEKAKRAKVPHAAMDGECTACHDPHASPQARLLRTRGEALCSSCHGSHVRKPSEVAHGALTQLGCPGCHLAHGGGNAALLRTAGNDLCNGCHLADLTRPAPDGSVQLPGGFRLDASEAQGLKRIALDAGRRKNHPILEHPVAGMPSGKNLRTPLLPALVGKETTCLSCHQPHFAKSRKLLVGDATVAAQLCRNCHPK